MPGAWALSREVQLRKAGEAMTKKWDITWEIANDDEGTLTGTTRIMGESVVDALNKFFECKDNSTKKMVGVQVVSEDIDKTRKVFI